MTDQPEISPALTPEAWREELEKLAADRAHNVPEWRSLDSNIAARRGPHALAALALYGQPFGFTQEDVANLLEVIDEAECNGNRQWPGIPHAKCTAAKIVALLCPVPSPSGG